MNPPLKNNERIIRRNLALIKSQEFLRQEFGPGGAGLVDFPSGRL
jgi:hypothetical protein